MQAHAAGTDGAADAILSRYPVITQHLWGRHFALGARFARLIGDPRVMRASLGAGMAVPPLLRAVVKVMGNTVDPERGDAVDRAVRVLEGIYEMGIAHGAGSETPTKITSTIIAHAPSEYEMVEPDGWHWVRPIGAPSLSVMVTGTPWDRWSPRSDAAPRPLPAERARAILSRFAPYYPSRAA